MRDLGKGALAPGPSLSPGSRGSKGRGNGEGRSSGKLGETGQRGAAGRLLRPHRGPSPRPTGVREGTAGRGWAPHPPKLAARPRYLHGGSPAARCAARQPAGPHPRSPVARSSGVACKRASAPASDVALIAGQGWRFSSGPAPRVSMATARGASASASAPVAAGGPGARRRPAPPPGAGLRGCSLGGAATGRDPGRETGGSVPSGYAVSRSAQGFAAACKC